MLREPVDAFLSRLETESGLELPDFGPNVAYAMRAEWLLRHRDHARLTVWELDVLREVFHGTHPDCRR